MKTIGFAKKIVGAGAALFALLSLPSPLPAADFSERQELARRSAATGLGREEIPLLKRMPGPGMRNAARVLESMFQQGGLGGITTQGKQQEQEQVNHISMIGDDWFLNIYGDGTAVRYRNYGYLDGKSTLAVPVAERPDNATLRKLGEQFIARTLADIVVLGSNETLVPLFTEYQISGGGSTQRGAPRDPEMVTASTVVFGRSVDGIPVVGAGSKVAIIFANDSTPAGFDIEWGRYEPTGRMQKVLPLQGIQQRGRKLASLPMDSPEVTVKRFECGYFDAGVRKRDMNAPVQGGCFMQYFERSVIDEKAHRRDPNSGHIISAYADAIPAGDPPAPDRSWLETETVLAEVEQGPQGPQGPKKVLVCHFPPGEPDKCHEIMVGQPAVDSHLKHGDTLGSCPGFCRSR